MPSDSWIAGAQMILLCAMPCRIAVQVSSHDMRIILCCSTYCAARHTGAASLQNHDRAAMSALVS